MATSKLPPVARRDEDAVGPYLRAVRHRPLVVLAAVLAALVVSAAWLTARTRSYEATAQILVTPISGDIGVAGLPLLSDSVDPTRTLQTAATILDSPRAGVEAAAELGRGWTPNELFGAVTVAAQGDSNVIAVTAAAPDAEDAAAAANAYAAAALRVRAEALADRVEAQVASLQAQRQALGQSDPTTSAALAGKIAALESIGDGQDPNFSPLQAASAPDAPVGTAGWMVLGLALFAGLAIGVGAALVLEHVDRRVHDEDDLLELYPLPVLARVPIVRRRRDLPGVALPHDVREALRTLQVQLESHGRGSRVVLFTSPSAGDGKTTSAIDFATSLLAADHRVILLDLDLRKPDVGATLGVTSDVMGLFRRDVDLEDLLVPAPWQPALRILSAPPRDDISRVLAGLTRQLPDLLSQARELADYVVIDTAPLGRVSDALRVAAAADDVLLVTRPGNTNAKELAVSRELLERLGITPTGMVIVGSTGPGNAYYGHPVPEAAELTPVPGGRGAAAPRRRRDERGRP